ncbi:hexaprenyldihydroxybenzoate methyltransferase, putative [Ricinus communis]|uniref:Hexaprenyldihydroxybenzoate methyltransferase, putative n=1 Tax=Ricinus communis TaxID=3988 RepID=B9S8D8_RICCO|nr:hexaprenyldihydroxybenzoate methyltransferase, putative [Ricinus communis]
MAASKLLTKIRAIQNLQIGPNPNQRLLNATIRHFSHQPISAPPPPYDNNNRKTADNKHQKVSSLKDIELAKFSAIADTWWDSEGPFKPLHAMNPTRLAFIRSTLCRHFRKNQSSARPFDGLKIIDVGCGGGILSEPLARMGATVTGVDAVEKNIKIACLHADLDPLTSTIEYCCTTAEKLVEEQRKFDAVIALELPKGTHQWSSFLTPEELVLILKRGSIDVKEMAGFVYNPLTARWSLSDDISVNFIIFGTKNGQ